jgi:RNA polymerase sigma factor (sigma-70 family)
MFRNRDRACVGQAPGSPAVSPASAATSDAHLLSQYRAERSNELFAQIVQRHGPMVLRTCLRLVGNIPDAEDATQNTFQQLAQRPEHVNVPLGVWLHAVARRAACDLVRSRVRRVRREQVAAHGKQASVPGGDDQFALREELDEALGKLPDSLREAVILRYLEGWKQEEAAHLAGCPQGTLARRAMEGLARMREVLARRGTVLTGVALAALLAREAQAAALPMKTIATLGTAATATGAHTAAKGGLLKLALGVKAKLAVALTTAAVGVGVVVHSALPSAPDVPKNERATLIGHDHGVFCVALSPDGKQAATGSGDRTVKLWDASSGKELATLSGHEGMIEAVAISPDGKTLASGDNTGMVKVWDVASRRERYTVAAHVEDVPRRDGEGVHRLAFSPDGNTIAAASWNGVGFVWDTADGRLRYTLRGHDSGLTAVAFLPDGKRIITASNDQTVRLWDFGTGKELACLTGHTDPVHAIACAPDGRTAASGSMGGTVIVWDLDSGKPVRTWKMNDASVHELAFSPDGRTLAAGTGDRTAKLWDPETGQERVVLRGHINSVSSLSFSADGRYLATSSYDRTAKVWGP